MIRHVVKYVKMTVKAFALTSVKPHVKETAENIAVTVQVHAKHRVKQVV